MRTRPRANTTSVRILHGVGLHESTEVLNNTYQFLVYTSRSTPFLDWRESFDRRIFRSAVGQLGASYPSPLPFEGRLFHRYTSLSEALLGTQGSSVENGVCSLDKPTLKVVFGSGPSDLSGSSEVVETASITHSLPRRLPRFRSPSSPATHCVGIRFRRFSDVFDTLCDIALRCRRSVPRDPLRRTSCRAERATDPPEIPRENAASNSSTLC